MSRHQIIIIGLALQQWVEKGVPPSSIIATRYPQDALKQSLKMPRPLCPYPERAVWTGTGSTDDAANFACKAR
jgi:Tannase and feruloyl esterase